MFHSQDLERILPPLRLPPRSRQARANGTVAACAAGDAFIGIAVSQRGDFVGVQLKGYRNAAVTGSVPVGWAQLVADGSGGVKAAGEDAAGVSVLVVSAGTAEIGMIL